MHMPPLRKWALSIALIIGLPAGATTAPVLHLQVKVVTGAVDLSPGSVLELRIYEPGRPVRRFPLSHGESWPRDSTRVISLQLSEPLEPRNVARFALFYRAASPLSPPLDIVAADVELAADHAPVERLLGVTLTGTIARGGELATEEREPSSMTCSTDADCDDHRRCNGEEHCAPRSAGADVRGCVKGKPLTCPVNQVCTEARGCLGPESISPK